MKILSDTRLLIIAVWLGAAVFFSFSVAPGAFRVLPTRELAGLTVQHNLMIVNYAGMVVGLLTFLTSFAGNSGRAVFFVWAERVFLVLVVAACAVGQFAIGWWIQMVRTEIGRPIDELAVDDPVRIKFNDIHEYSVWLLVTAMIAALLAFFIISARNHNTPAKKPAMPDFRI
jgi:hypothetical protein